MYEISQMIDIICELYYLKIEPNVSVCVRVTGKIGENFENKQGDKQNRFSKVRLDSNHK